MSDPETKADKMRFIIRRELERSLFLNLEKQLNAQAPYVRKLKAHPGFLPAVLEELIELQLPYYMMADDATAEAAYQFFKTPAGSAWCDLCGRFNDKLPQILNGFVIDLVKRLDALTLN